MSFLSDSFHLFIRWMKKLVRNPILIFFSLFQPVIFLVLFTQLFNKFGALLGPGVSYTVFATAGIVLQNAFSSAFQSGTAVVDDIRSGFLTKILATPVNRTAILFGRILSDVFRVVVQTVIILVLAYALGVFLRLAFQDTCSSFLQWPPLGSPGPAYRLLLDLGPKVRRLSLE